MVGLVIAGVALAAGGYAVWRWAPPLRGTAVGRWAAVVTAVLAGAALAVAALDIYEMVRALDRGGFGRGDTDIVAGALAGMLGNAGVLLGLAAAVHLLAPGED